MNLRESLRTALSIQEAQKFDLEGLKATHPKVYKHLHDRSREARLNTGDPAGEYGTYHHIKSLPSSQHLRNVEHGLVHATMEGLGPDMSWDKTGLLMARTRRVVPGGDIMGAFENGSLSDHMEPLVVGRQSDRYRHSGDRYY